MARAVGVDLPFPLLTIDCWEQTSTTKVLDAPRAGSFGNRGLLQDMEVTMTMDTDHHTTDTADNSLAIATWMLIGLVAFGAVALWFYAI